MRRSLILACVCIALLGGRCDDSQSDAARLPEGTTLLAKTAGLKRSVERLTELDATPLARWARGLLQSLPDCPLVEAHAASGLLADLWPAIECAVDTGLLASSIGDHDIAFAQVRDGRRIVGLADVSTDGDVSLDVAVPQSFAEGGFGLLLPAAKPPGAPVLSGDDTLLHTRIRPAAGLDLASLVPDDSQGAEMFRLKNELFAGVVLEGSWELAVYLPEEGSRMPKLALALPFHHRGAAVAAMDSFIEELEQTWPVARSHFRIGEAEGACLLTLKLLPDLAPCYVASDAALVVGWNPASLRQSLGGTPQTLSAWGDLGGATVDLARFGQADEILSRALETPAAALPRSFPWHRLIATGKPSDAGFQVHVQLQTGPSS